MKCLFIYFLIVFLSCCVSSCNKAQNSNLTDISSKNLAENSVSNNYPTEIDNKTLSEEANVFNSKILSFEITANPSSGI